MQARLALHPDDERRTTSSQLFLRGSLGDQRLILHQRHLQLRGLLHHGLSLPTDVLGTVRQEEQIQGNVRTCDLSVDSFVKSLGLSVSALGPESSDSSSFLTSDLLYTLLNIDAETCYSLITFPTTPTLPASSDLGLVKGWDDHRRWKRN